MKERPDLDGKRVRSPDSPQTWLVYHGQRHRMPGGLASAALFSDPGRVEATAAARSIAEGEPLHEGASIVRDDAGEFHLLNVVHGAVRRARLHSLETMLDYGFEYTSSPLLKVALVRAFPADPDVMSARDRVALAVIDAYSSMTAPSMTASPVEQLFAKVWYLGRNPDVAASGGDPFEHFLMHGAAENRDPNPLFDVDWYLEQSPEVVVSGENPLVHYVREGASKGRSPSPWFDTAWYNEAYPDVGASGVNPLVHFLLFGAAEGRHPRRPGT